MSARPAGTEAVAGFGDEAGYGARESDSIQVWARFGADLVFVTGIDPGGLLIDDPDQRVLESLAALGN